VSARARHEAGPGGGAKGEAERAKCPICGKPRSPDHRPFCSKRCADIDLGRWLKGRYAVPGEPVAKPKDEPPEEDGGA
jgi:endogenous inhibitor of DNA gyrase (YacG/DUF329 family)